MPFAFPRLRLVRLAAAFLVTVLAHSVVATDAARLVELNAFWSTVSRSVREGDFDGYRATCHEEGVLVSGTSKTSYPLARALERWKAGFVDTRAGTMKASVEFRFSQRFGDATTAHETGIFRYATTDAAGQSKTNFVHFEALLVKHDTWKTLMEFQKGPGTEGEWNQLVAGAASVH
ncbi:MAG: hypothetical protein IT581_06780 [Verrucomicrobiales bacterium]|nr:hypothetical protein [Verrucomicrobiales bacterium]